MFFQHSPDFGNYIRMLAGNIEFFRWIDIHIVQQWWVFSGSGVFYFSGRIGDGMGRLASILALRKKMCFVITFADGINLCAPVIKHNIPRTVSGSQKQRRDIVPVENPDSETS